MKKIYVILGMLLVLNMGVLRAESVENRMGGLTKTQQEILDGQSITIGQIRHELAKFRISSSNDLITFKYVTHPDKLKEAWNDMAFLTLIFKHNLHVKGERYDHGSNEYLKQIQQSEYNVK